MSALRGNSKGMHICHMTNIQDVFAFCRLSIVNVCSKVKKKLAHVDLLCFHNRNPVVNLETFWTHWFLINDRTVTSPKTNL